MLQKSDLMSSIFSHVNIEYIQLKQELLRFLFPMAIVMLLTSGNELAHVISLKSIKCPVDMQLQYVSIKQKTLTITLILCILSQLIVVLINTECTLCRKISFRSLKNLRLRFWQNTVVDQRRRDIGGVRMGSASLHVATVGKRVIVGELVLTLLSNRVEC